MLEGPRQGIRPAILVRHHGERSPHHMAAKLHFGGRARVIASAVIIAASLFAAVFGHALVQARPAPSSPHHAAVTLDPPTSTAGGQITSNGASVTDADQQGDDVNDDHQGDEQDDGGGD
jgi:hypothetical protein